MFAGGYFTSAELCVRVTTAKLLLCASRAPSRAESRMRPSSNPAPQDKRGDTDAEWLKHEQTALCSSCLAPSFGQSHPRSEVMGSFQAFGELLFNSCLHRSTSWGWRCPSRHPGGLKSQRNAQKSSSGDCPRVVPALKGVQRAGQVTGEKSHLCCCVSRSWDSDYFRHKWS